ncbi:HlyD family secretion protein [Bacteroides heparinolyticus]|uniref:HlyD family efflux transporter periplasmic adaptor subunit n=3 Tax=Prevotella heparinolytica TaxID=28113 RepID=A0A3P2AAW8_9BACE|nr:HlyD family efflux transporter periplasmic adaptor subunit [Bacteroides heparinolyticus]RRD92577.1 HlyD family efflux transporter periplasmic adaptor subunit [Bacteroides heparinolyticus]
MLLPNEWIENSIETYIYQHTTKSQIIYWVVLLAITTTIVSLPFIYVDISVQGSGIVRPVAEKAEIASPITEIVDSVFVREGEQVCKGDIILRFRTNSSDYKINYQSARMNDCNAQLTDLDYLAKGECPAQFSSPVRRQEYAYFVKKKQALETALAQAEKEYNRNKRLFDKQVISEEEYDGYYFKWQNQQNELAALIQSQISAWQTDRNSYRNMFNEMNTNLKQEVKEKDMYIVRSPVDGTVDRFSGIYRGSNIQAGQSLAVISPDSTLCLEVYVTPRNIGFMSVGMPVNIQVESFNYNEWGTIPGKVKDISSDFLTDSRGNSFYKVKCEMDRDYLQLKNGRVGKLKKGMTVSAHFMVTRRSLFDLLYQKMDDWANPKQYANENMTAKLN